MSGIDTISTEAARVIREKDEEIKGLFGELQKTRRELATATDRSEYQSSRIGMLEEEVTGLRSSITSLETSLRDAATKSTSEDNRKVPRRERA